ncbi:MBL fold metallo-hydrolase [Paenibacillus sp. Soil750]|uniref:MBL fold metallo-hydrolase n=1 Tax=Paenibacillus sp. Soil750 TaxID=1736398 RepID=UPI0009EC98D8|nr:MBL fold metallo-hydrolase [Paenibacillus sp. Soil750]
MRFYGTSAAEGIPNPFCSCSVCNNAREVGGTEIRRRSMFRINEQMCIDLGADSFQQAIEYGDFTKLRHVLVSHTHEDHFNYMMMNVRNMSIERLKEPLHFYFTDQAYEIVEFYRQSRPIMKGMTSDLEARGVVAFHKLAFNESVTIAGMKVTPLRGNHLGNMGESCANYLIQNEDGQKLYYGVDTGWYLPETFKELENASLDVLISECTFGLTSGRGLHPNGHLDAFSCMELFRKLLAQGTLHANSRIYLTHINHFTSTHADLVGWIQEQQFPCPITVAWDGMII